MEQILEVDELLHLALDEPRDGHAGPAAHDLGDVLRVDLLLQHLLLGLEVGEARRRLLDLPVEIGDAAVTDLC